MRNSNNIINITQFLNECEKIKNEISEEFVRIDYSPVSCFEEGERHDRLVKLAGSLSRHGIDENSLIESLLNLNEQLCFPPLPTKEVREIARSVYKYKNYERNPNLQEKEPQSVQKKVSRLLYSNKGNDTLKKQQISNFIIKDLSEFVEFIQTEYGQNYLFNNETKELIGIHPENKNYVRLIAKYKINPTLPVYKFLLHEIYLHCFNTGEVANVYKFAHYDSNRNLVYIKCGKSQIYMVSEEAVTLCDNGTNGVLFSDLIDSEAFEYIINTDSTDYIGSYIINQCNYNNNEISAVTQKLLARAFFVSLLVPELLPTKPILTIIGQKGSAKTTLLKCFIKTLYGAKHNVCSMPSKTEDLDTLVACSHFLAIDNLDTHKDDLNDKLAVYSTGGYIKKRKLYTDAEMYTAFIDAFIGISTRALCFKRDDVLQRLILLSLNPINNNFIAESELMKPIVQYRNNLLSQVIDEIQVVLRNISSKKYENIRSGFRMADFAKFLTLLTNNYELSERCLAEMTRFQQNVSTDNDIIIPYLIAFTSTYPEKFYNAAAIYKLLSAYGKQIAKSEFWHNDFERSYANPLAFAKRLNNIKNDIREFIIVKTQKGRGNATEYSFKMGEHFEDIKHLADIVPKDIDYSIL